VAKVSICIEMLLTEIDLYDRPKRAADLGFPAIEFWGTSGKDIAKMKDSCDRAGVQVAGFLSPSGIPFVQAQPTAKLVEAMKQTVDIADQLETHTLIVTVGNAQEGMSAEEQTDNIVNNLSTIAPLAEDAGLRMAVEPLNTLVDHAGYFLDRTADGLAIVERVGSPAIGLLYDAYHMQVMEGNLIDTIRANVGMFNHVHIADVPGRMEPGTGEVNYINVLKALDEAGYEGFCGFEFRPSDSSDAALKRARVACGLD